MGKKAFISYSHRDSNHLETLHKFLVQLKREGNLETWTDEVINAGSRLDTVISNSLEGADIFLALLSQDYISSDYCYEIEFKRAMELESKGQLIIVPIILEPCDWLNTPFSDFKALPKDGKAISMWASKEMAFMNVIQETRRLLEVQNTSNKVSSTQMSGRVFKVERDFDSIEKLNEVKKGFDELKQLLEEYIQEINTIDDVKAMVREQDNISFEALIVNRKKAIAESTLSICLPKERGIQTVFYMGSSEYSIQVSIDEHTNKYFTLEHDKYNLYWKENFLMQNGENIERLAIKDIADSVFKDWLEKVGIGFES
ncbi:MAG: toll/interleukin-1 receptor domain-containing protein [Leeuwenhoekiella sp.]|jgi:hypothetical protein|uniref:toll/interleukin-1 receptor domain-containing protein n=1 Tax=Leeuwenhoekiella sp. TaxID=1977054 RepID=UPI003242D8AC|tara:strand:+ start:7568 stop:8509 length:942 start_codon:yes stop_codon:yes gene_type:complete